MSAWINFRRHTDMWLKGVSLPDGEIPTVRTRPITSQPIQLYARTAIWLTLGLLEMLVVSWLLDVHFRDLNGPSPFYYMRQLLQWGLVTAMAYIILVWPDRHVIAQIWQSGRKDHNRANAIAINLALFSLLALASIYLTHYSDTVAEPPWHLLPPYTVLLAATAASLLRIDAPITTMLAIAVRFRNETAISLAIGLIVILVSTLMLTVWDSLGLATLRVSHALLQLYEPEVAIDVAANALRVGDFVVLVTETCSGYEGIGLVSGFLTVYLWAMRKTLRFPHAFLMFPIGIAFIWLLNSVRIAALVSLGAHVSPRIASGGFHSQAGWIAFLIATITLMAAAGRVTWFHRSRPFAPVAAQATVPGKADDRVMTAYVAPFMGLMLASIAISASSPADKPIYPLKVVLVGIALWMFRDVWSRTRVRFEPVPVAMGLAVGAAWIASNPYHASTSDLASWLAAQPPAFAVLWISVRAIGACVMVPMAEELAFRGFLHRWLIDRAFDKVPFGRISILALVLNSVLFGLMHDRWIAGILAGLVFTLAMYRSKSIAGPIAAHVVANAIIFLWAVVFRDWSLL